MGRLGHGWIVQQPGGKTSDRAQKQMSPTEGRLFRARRAESNTAVYSRLAAVRLALMAGTWQQHPAVSTKRALAVLHQYRNRAPVFLLERCHVRPT